MTVVTRQNMSIVTLMVARHRLPDVLSALFSNGIYDALLSGARGTMIKDKWYQSLLPMISPELEIIRMIVPDTEVDGVLELAIRHAQLQRSGSGAVYSTPCDDLHACNDFPLWPLMREERPEEDASASLNENLTAIQYISQGERTDAICRAAMGVGSHGPVIQYTEGVGIRDRLGWLKITSKPIKEAVTVLVDNVDANPMFAAMSRAGMVQRAGHGLIYSMPIQKGLVNLDSIYSETLHSASAQQIIRAIDDLKGSKEWRDQNSINAQGGHAAGLNFAVKTTRDQSLKKQSQLSILVERSQAHQLSRSVIAYGAPGVNIDYAQYRCSAEQKDEKQHREMAFVRIVTDPGQARELQQRVLDEIDMEMVIFTQPVSQTLFYKAEVAEPPAKTRFYRGSRANT